MSTLAVKTNCVWALSNLAGSSLDIRDRILDDDELIFHSLGRCVEDNVGIHGYKACQRLLSEVVTLIKTMVMQDHITEAQFQKSFVFGLMLVGQTLDRFEFNFKEEGHLTLDAEHHLQDLVACLILFSDLELYDDFNRRSSELVTYKINETISNFNLH